MTDQTINLNDPSRDDHDVERWLGNLWRERANPLMRNGHSLDEIFWTVVDAGILRAVQEPSSRAIIADSLYDIAKQHDRFGRSDDALQARMADRFKAFERLDRARPLKKKPLAPTPFVLRDPAEIKCRPWLYGRHYMRGQVSATVGRTKGGKTTLTISEILAMTTGRPLLGKTVEMPLRVWFIGEDVFDEIERRVVAACMHFNVTMEQLEGRLYIDSRLDFDNLRIAEQTVKGIKINESTLEQLKKQMKLKQIDVVVLDPLIKFHGVPENDNTAMDLVVFALSQISNELDIAIGLLHHPRKQSPGAGPFTIEDSRGGSAVVSGVRIPRVLNTMSSADAAKAGILEADRKEYFSVTTESNMSPAEAAEWYRLVSVILPCGESVGVAEAWKFPDPFRGVTSADLGVAQRLAQTGAYRDDSRSPDWFGWALAEHLKIPIRYNGDNSKADMARVKAIIRKWLDNNVLEADPRTDEHRKMRNFIIPGKALSVHTARTMDMSDDEQLEF
jgi:hypothetical protein